MKLTTQELDEMQRVDIGATSADTLPDVSGMAFQKGLSREDRITRFMQGAKNLYCYCVGGVGVKIEFAESGPSLQDTLGDFLIRAKSGLYETIEVLYRSESGEPILLFVSYDLGKTPFETMSCS